MSSYTCSTHTCFYARHTFLPSGEILHYTLYFILCHFALAPGLSANNSYHVPFCYNQFYRLSDETYARANLAISHANRLPSQKFPYALNALSSVIKERWDAPDFAPYRDAFPAEAQASPEAFEAHVQDLTARDVKIAYLKNLQGYLWQAGYENGAYSTPLFSDVAPQLNHWKDSGIRLAIYSSGSVFAQKLLFGHVQDPTASDSSKHTQDLRGLISDWFDTTNAGLKMEAGSYTSIADKLGKPSNRILFLSDNVKEVEAALVAGMKAIVVDRPGNAVVSEEERTKYKVVDSLDHISLSIAQIDSRFWKR